MRKEKLFNLGIEQFNKNYYFKNTQLNDLIIKYLSNFPEDKSHNFIKTIKEQMEFFDKNDKFFLKDLYKLFLDSIEEFVMPRDKLILALFEMDNNSTFVKKRIKIFFNELNDETSFVFLNDFLLKQNNNESYYQVWFSLLKKRNNINWDVTDKVINNFENLLLNKSPAIELKKILCEYFCLKNKNKCFSFNDFFDKYIDGNYNDEINTFNKILKKYNFKELDNSTFEKPNFSQNCIIRIKLDLESLYFFKNSSKEKATQFVSNVGKYITKNLNADQQALDVYEFNVPISEVQEKYKEYNELIEKIFTLFPDYLNNYDANTENNIIEILLNQKLLSKNLKTNLNNNKKIKI